MEPSQSNFRKHNTALKYISFGTELLALLGIGVYGGFKLDAKWNTLPLFTILLPMIGLVFSFSKLLRSLQQDKKQKK